MNRSQLNSFRATAGLGQGAVRSTNVRSNDKMGGYNSFPQSPTYEGGGMQVSPQEMFGQKPVTLDDRSGGMGNAPGPAMPQFNAPQRGAMAQRGGGSSYSQQLGNFISRGGQLGSFKPRMGATAPQYREQGMRPPVIPQMSSNKPFGGNIDPVDPYVGA